MCRDVDTTISIIKDICGDSSKVLDSKERYIVLMELYFNSMLKNEKFNMLVNMLNISEDDKLSLIHSFICDMYTESNSLDPNMDEMPIFNRKGELVKVIPIDEFHYNYSDIDTYKDVIFGNITKDINGIHEIVYGALSSKFKLVSPSNTIREIREELMFREELINIYLIINAPLIISYGEVFGEYSGDTQEEYLSMVYRLYDDDRKNNFWRWII